MNHLAIIQTEFVKEARKWSELSLLQQKDYLARHPKSKRRLTSPSRRKKQIQSINRSDHKNILRAVSTIQEKLKEAGFGKRRITSKFDNVVKARNDIKEFYSDPSLSSHDSGYPYILANYGDKLNNGPMMSAFRKTHLRMNVGNWVVIAGYLALGTSGIGLRPQRSAWR